MRTTQITDKLIKTCALSWSVLICLPPRFQPGSGSELRVLAPVPHAAP